MFRYSWVTRHSSALLLVNPSTNKAVAYGWLPIVVKVREASSSSGTTVAPAVRSCTASSCGQTAFGLSVGSATVACFRYMYIPYINSNINELRGL